MVSGCARPKEKEPIRPFCLSALAVQVRAAPGIQAVDFFFTPYNAQAKCFGPLHGHQKSSWRGLDDGRRRAWHA